MSDFSCNNDSVGKISSGSETVISRLNMRLWFLDGQIFAEQIIERVSKVNIDCCVENKVQTEIDHLKIQKLQFTLSKKVEPKRLHPGNVLETGATFVGGYAFSLIIMPEVELSY